MLKIDTLELTEFVKSVIQAVDNSKHREMVLQSEIEFELAVVTKSEGGGKVKILVVDAGGSYAKETVSKIKFSVGYKEDTKKRETGRHTPSKT